MAGYQQFTWSLLISQFYERVGNNAVFWTKDEVIRILNESMRVFNCLAGFWRDRIDTGAQTVAGQIWYATPVQLTYILRVEVNRIALASTTLYDLDYGRPEWENDICLIGTFPQMFAPMGQNLYALWPAPFESTNSLIVEGVVPAPQYTADTDNVNIGTEEVRSVLDYAEHVAQFKEGGQEFEAAQQLLQKFLKQCGARNAMLMQSSRFRRWMGLTDERKRPIRRQPETTGARR
jgi:hypothetical protein